MASIKYYLDTRSGDPDGDHPLKISLSHRGTSTLIMTGIKLKESQWTGTEVVRHPVKNEINTLLAEKKFKLERRLIELADEGRLAGLNAGQVKALLFTKRDDVFFVQRFIAYMESRKSERTRDIYKATLSWMKKYDRLLDTRRFEDITREWLKKFDVFMSEKSPSLNARAIHFRNIRAVFNDAIDDGLTQFYPFRKFKIGQEQTRKRSLSVEELREIATMPLDEQVARYRDLFMLMFYLIGINTIDLCALKRIEGGRIEYRRAKTGRIYSIKVEPEALEIIRRYKGRKNLLDIMDGRHDYRVFAALMNRYLHRIRPGLSAYWCRHTWATIAAELDIPKETIAAGLGHALGNSTTSIYIDFNMKKVDEANRRVIDYVLYGKK